MKKENKIIVVVDPNLERRKQAIAKIALNLGFAKMASDAMKIIKSTPYDYDLPTCYFVLAATYNFHDSNITNQRLYEMAARGMAVIVGCKRLPPNYEFCCQAFFPGDI